MRESTRKGSALGQELPSPPSDGITSLRFSPQSDHLLVSSWDAKLRLYNATTNVLKAQFSDRAAVLDCCFHDDSSGFSANADFTVCRYDFNTSTEDLLGTHNAQVSCVEYSHASGQLVTGSWDKTVQCWDARGGTRVGTYKQSERVCKMSLVGHRLVVATKKRHLAVYDLRHMAESDLQSLSSNKFETQCVRCYPDGTGYALSSADGRVTMDYFDTSEASQAQKYAFRCHRRAEAGPDPCYPVYGLDFHPVYGTLSTGGSDGYVNVWDGNSKKRLHQYSRYPNSIAALAFNRDGRLLAVACSSPVEEEEKKHEPAIYLRHLNEAEVRQKRREGKTSSHLP